MGLALDEPGKEDKTVERDGITYIVGSDMERMLPPNARLDIGLDAWRGGLYVRIAGQREC
ncbi:MAG: hypothetical protein EP329_02120 [Deltaproteobacteria bacterium]|nr:MAG: hypothetical protein EP329_02120 [Deltaproteobacteria bacterium]